MQALLPFSLVENLAGSNAFARFKGPPWCSDSQLGSVAATPLAARSSTAVYSFWRLPEINEQPEMNLLVADGLNAPRCPPLKPTHFLGG